MQLPDCGVAFSSNAEQMFVNNRSDEVRLFTYISPSKNARAPQLFPCDGVNQCATLKLHVSPVLKRS